MGQLHPVTSLQLGRSFQQQSCFLIELFALLFVKFPTQTNVNVGHRFPPWFDGSLLLVVYATIGEKKLSLF
jgi:hypothetical protein